MHHMMFNICLFVYAHCRLRNQQLKLADCDMIYVISMMVVIKWDQCL